MTPVELSERLREHRAHKDAFFATDPRSPIPLEERHGFDGLEYYELDPSLRFHTDLEPVDPIDVPIATTTGDERVYQKVAGVQLTIDASRILLSLYAGGGESLFLPWRDATSGIETYGAGRYLDIEVEGPRVTIDFNYAYPPFCAYNDAYSCALPPADNWLDVPIRAGERLPVA